MILTVVTRLRVYTLRGHQEPCHPGLPVGQASLDIFLSVTLSQIELYVLAVSGVCSHMLFHK